MRARNLYGKDDKMGKVKQQDIDQLIVLVGGRENIATVSHCITRLRLY